MDDLFGCGVPQRIEKFMGVLEGQVKLKLEDALRLNGTNPSSDVSSSWFSSSYSFLKSLLAKAANFDTLDFLAEKLDFSGVNQRILRL